MTEPESAPIDEWITTAEAAKLLGVTRMHVVRLIHAGVLEGRMVNPRLWLVNRQSLRAWVRKRNPKGGSESTE
jgi:excisionase family DNA binding protein